MSIQVALENILIPENLCFHDRGVPDSLAYIEYANGNQYYARKMLKKRKYLAVFLLDLLPFEHDYARTENSEKAKIIENLIYKAYNNLGYKITRVPVLTIEKRIEFILNSLSISSETM